MSKIRSLAGEARDSADNNRRLVYLVVGGLAIANWLGWIDLGIPEWWPLGAVVAVAAWYVGRRAAEHIADLLPEPEGILLLELRADDLGGGRLYELSEDAYDDMEIEGGDVFEWPETSRRVVEVRDYDPETNTAVANWRESKPASALAEPPTVDDCLAAIRELREDLEPDAAEARELRRRIRGIVRALDRERAEAQQAVLDEQVAPDLGGGSTISEVVERELPDELHPETRTDEKGDGEADTEAEPVDLADVTPETDESELTAAPDGGQPDE